VCLSYVSVWIEQTVLIAQTGTCTCQVALPSCFLTAHPAFATGRVLLIKMAQVQEFPNSKYEEIISHFSSCKKETE